MFRTEVARLMATVFYTPGLMELVDSLTRQGVAPHAAHLTQVCHPLPLAKRGSANVANAVSGIVQQVVFPTTSTRGFFLASRDVASMIHVAR